VTSLVLYLVLGASLLLLLVFALLRRPGRPEGSSQALLDARQALTALQRDLLPPEVVQRVFAKQDLEYVLASSPEPVHRVFLDERRKVAMIWVRQVRRGVLSLRAFHLGQARHYARVNLATELQLAANFALLLIACRALEVALFFGGPYAAPQVLGRTVGVAGKLCRVSQQSLAFLSPDLLRNLSEGSAAGRARI
jgi:hypothetical protein